MLLASLAICLLSQAPYGPPETPVVRAAPDSSVVESNIQDRVGAMLLALAPGRADYHLRKRALAVRGVVTGDEPWPNVMSGFFAEAKKAVEAASGSSSIDDLPLLWWQKWESYQGQHRLSAESSDLAFHVKSSPEVFLRTYTDFMPGVELTERYRAELFTTQHYLLLTEDSRFGSVAHLQNRLNYALESPHELLSPLPTDRKKTAGLREWRWSRSVREEGELIRIENPERSGIAYSLLLDPESGLPRGAVLRAGENTLASVYSWSSTGGGLVWLRSAARLTVMANRYRVELYDVSEVDLVPEPRVALRTARPAKMLDQRFGRPKYMEFSADYLPKDVKNALVLD